LPSSNCDCHESIRLSTKDLKNSSSLNSSQSLSYTIGQVSGNLHRASFSLKSFDFELPFLLVDSEKDLFWMMTDGFLGLGLDLNMSNSVITKLHESKSIKKTRFSIFLSKDEDYKASELTFGSYEEDDYSDSEGIVINITAPQWRATFDSFSFSSLKRSEKFEVLFSPGFFGILGPSKTIKQMHSIINNSLSCQSFLLFLKCENSESSHEALQSLPSLNFTYNKFNISIPPSSYTFHSNNSILVLLGEHNSKSWVLGQGLFKEYFSVFDVNSTTISLFKVSSNSGISHLLYFIVGIFLAVVIFVPVLVYWTVDKPKDQISSDIDNRRELLLTNKP
jgi:hypothetical protein